MRPGSRTPTCGIRNSHGRLFEVGASVSACASRGSASQRGTPVSEEVWRNRQAPRATRSSTTEWQWTCLMLTPPDEQWDTTGV